MTRIAVSFVGGFLLGVIAIWVYDASFIDDSLAQLPELDDATQENVSTDTVLGKSPSAVIATSQLNDGDTTQIVVRNQEAGVEVRIDVSTLQEDGWVVIHEEQNDVIGNALGALRRSAGSHEDLTVPLLRETQPGQRYFVVIYTDNGDREFGLSNDFPARNENDQPIIAAFFAE